jgi:hypothetical protein
MLSRCHRDVLIVFHNDSPTQGVEIVEHCAAVGLYAHGDSIYTNYWFRARRNGNPSRMVDNLTYDFTYHMDKAMSITNSKQTLRIKKEDYVPTKDRNIEHCERELKLLQDYGYEVNDPSRTAPQELDWLLSSVRPRTEPGEVDADGAPNQVV